MMTMMPLLAPSAGLKLKQPMMGGSSSKNKKKTSRPWRWAAACSVAVAASSAEAEVEALRLLTEERWVAEHILPLLRPVEDAWQPAELLPSMAGGGGGKQVAELQAGAAEVPDDILVCLVGNMVTEEGLPTYMTMANRVRAAGVEDATGCDEHGWARWVRGWTAEENRHGDLLNRYLYLCGRVDMRQVEVTVHHLLRRGMGSLPLPSSPAPAPSSSSCYRSFIYGAFQERATFVSHARTAKLCGDPCLARLCGLIAADEKRHEAAYTRAAALLFAADPDGMLRALAAMMRAKITMPGELMTDGRDHRLFHHFSAVAQRAGVYTAADYADMVDHFVRKWGVPDLLPRSGEGRQAQEYVCGLPRKIRRLDQRAAQHAQHQAQESVRFSWVFDRPVRIR